jgi:hypothetical protein
VYASVACDSPEIHRAASARVHAIPVITPRSSRPITTEEFMRNSALLATIAGAMFAGAAGLPGQADAMTFSGAAGMRSAAAAADVAQPQQIRYCNWRGCWHGAPYWPGSPYGLWQTYPYVGYNLVPGGYYYRPLVWPHAWGYRPW